MLRLVAYVVLGATLVALVFGVVAMRPRPSAAPDLKQAMANAGPVDEPVGDEGRQPKYQSRAFSPATEVDEAVGDESRQAAAEGRGASGAAVGGPAPGPASPREGFVPWAPPTDEPALEQVVLPRDPSAFGGAVERVPAEPPHADGGPGDLDTAALLQRYLEALRILEMD